MMPDRPAVAGAIARPDRWPLAAQMWLAGWLLVMAAVPAAAEPLQFFADFRDGSLLIISLPDERLPWQQVSALGEVTESPVRLGQVAQLHLALAPATKQFAAIRALVRQLGNDDYQRREQAQQELVKRGACYRKLLQQSLERTADFEVRWRLQQILKVLPPHGAAPEPDYDRLLLADEPAEQRGEVGSWSPTVSYRGALVKLDRRQLAALRRVRTAAGQVGAPAAARVRRIAQDDDRLFPEDVVRVDFERGPQGQKLALGTDVSRTFVPLGCILSTSIADSYVAIEPYNVGGRSGGRCAATHHPLYQGILTIRFCQPGNPKLAAGVHYVGFWTAHIEPQGTMLQAFDAYGNLIGQIATQRRVRDFLALYSSVPIASIRVVPDEKIDPDYAIDDLVFDPPAPLAEAGDPDHFGLLLVTGERLYCTSLTRSGSTVVLRQLTCGLDKLAIPEDELAMLVPPRSPSVSPGGKDRCFARLTDGSVLCVRSQDGLRWVRDPQLKIDARQLVALWGAKQAQLEPPVDRWPEGRALLVADDASEPIQIDQWRLGAQWIESPSLKDPSRWTYATSPVIWFRRPSQRPPQTGLLRTSAGEQLVLGPRDFRLLSWSADGVVIGRGDAKWMIPMAHVCSLLLPRRSGG